MRWFVLHTSTARAHSAITPPPAPHSLQRPAPRMSRVAPVVATVAAMLLLGLGTAQSAPSGLVQEPRLTGLDVSDPASKLFNYKGYTNFPGSQGKVEIYVLKQGNGDSSDATLWLKVLEVRPSETGTVVGSETRYAWSTGDQALFKNGPGENRWPQGGTARLRFKAVRGSESAYLKVRDSDGKLGRDLVLILADYHPNPTQPPSGQLTPNYLSKKSIRFPAQDPPGWTEENETSWYYSHAFVDQAQTQTITQALPALQSFRERYFGPIVENPARPDCVELSTPEVVTKYFNKGDLGLGREMHCIDNQCTREIACYVKNYGAVDSAGNPVLKFDDRAAAQQALQQGKHFATVAMVERQWLGFDAPNQVIFLVFDPHDNLSTGPVRLDNKGFNTFNPGNCLVCHGTSSSYDWDSATITSAFFLPFDLQAFEYFSSDSANPLSRAQQEDEFKALNRIVYFTDLYFLDAANTLIDKWYDFFTRSTFLNDAVPDAWNQNDNSRQLYKKVVAKACRTCHISEEQSPGLAFGAFADFEAYKTISALHACGTTKYMPQAEQTIKILWRSSARAHFLNRLQLPAGCGYEVTTPADYEFKP
jgi:hypothetical protein